MVCLLEPLECCILVCHGVSWMVVGIFGRILYGFWNFLEDSGCRSTSWRLLNDCWYLLVASRWLLLLNSFCYLLEDSGWLLLHLGSFFDGCYYFLETFGMFLLIVGVLSLVC